MRVKMIAPSGEEYTFEEAEYLKAIILIEKDKEVAYWIKKSTKGKGAYMNSQEPKEL